MYNSRFAPSALLVFLKRCTASIVEALQVLYWILFKPSAWHSLVQSIDPELPDSFCLLYLQRSHFKSKPLRHLLLLGFVVLPIIFAISEQLFRLLASDSPTTLNQFQIKYALNAAAKASGMLRIGGAFAVFISVYAGIIAMFIDIISNEGIHQIFTVALDTQTEGAWFATSKSFVQSYPSIYILIFSFSGAFSALLRLRYHSKDFRLDSRAIGAVVLGFIAVSGLCVLQIVTLRSRSFFLIGIVAFGGLVVFSLSTGVALYLRKRRWHKGAIVAFVFCITYAILTAIGSTVTKFCLSSGPYSSAMSDAFRHGIRQIISSSLIMALLAPMVVGEMVGGAVAAAFAGGVGAPLCWLFITIYTDENWSIRGPSEKLLVKTLTPLCILLGWSLPYWQRYALYPFEAAWNRLIYQLDIRRSPPQRSLLRWHSTFWDEMQTLRMEGLSEHLLLVCNRWPEVGTAALKQLATSSQRWAPQVVQLELELLALEQCADMAGLANVQKQLGGVTTHGLGTDQLRYFSRLSQDVAAAMASLKNPYQHRLALRTVEDQMNRLARDLTLSGDPLAIRFLRILNRWQDILATHQVQRQQAIAKFIEDPYIIGLPLAEGQAVFVGRTHVSAQVELLIRSKHAPPVLLYGQRRMGKTSLLRNLRVLLPSTWVTLFVDLQGICSAQSHTGFLFQLARTMSSQLLSQRGTTIEHPSRQDLASDPFVVFDVWLDRFSEKLHDLSALLMLDEFEQLDAALRAGRFDAQPLLGMLRHMVQHKPKFRVLLAGSHMLSEVSAWSSYLINVRTIKLGCLRDDESRQLVEKPMPDFALQYHPAALSLVLSLTSGHPYLLQLLCARIIEMKNQQDEEQRFFATVFDVEAAIEPVLDDAVLVFGEITANQISSPGLTALQLLAQRGQGAVLLPSEPNLTTLVCDGQTWDPLVQRDLVELTERGYRFQNELFRRWFSSHRARVLAS